MKIAIYSRKSRYTDKGESIQNQIQACKDYAEKFYNESIEYSVYIDEGFSGKNTDRPEFLKMIHDVKDKKFQVLMCYKLDRLSRSVSDFARTYEELEKCDVQFVSVKEQFDTSTPMGRVMLNISVVFAQFERETIAERVKDNMYANARKGNWTGGTAPMGYSQKQESYINEKGQVKKTTVLIQDEKEAEIIRFIFDKYLELKSLNALVTYLMNNNIKTRNSCYFATASLYDLLKNPTYAIADQRLYTYFENKNMDLCNTEDEYTGEYAVLPYNRHNKKKNCINNEEDWIISIGKHKGIISSEIWIAVQKTLSSNAQKHPRVQTGDLGILSGLIKCSHCGSTMRVKKGNISKKDNQQKFVYLCSLKEKSKLEKCNIANIQGQEADKKIIEYLLSLIKDTQKFEDNFSIPKTNQSEDLKMMIKKYEKKLSENNTKINNLINILSETENKEIGKGILLKIEILQKENEELNSKIKENKLNIDNEKNIKTDLEILFSTINKLKDIDGLNINQKRNFMKILINKIIWDGKDFKIHLNKPSKINF